MKRRFLLVLALAFGVAAGPRLAAFCGFYVAKADTSLFNRASQVALVRSGDRTVMTMANDFQGDLKEFAVVIPVPTVVKKEQVNVGNKALLDHLDAYTAPRLVEYFDEDPCRPPMPMAAAPAGVGAGMTRASQESAQRRGVTIEASYTVGEYDILILSARESDGLERWLTENGYRIPKGAGPVLGSYIRQNMKFFVARVNLAEQAKTGFTYLRPIQVAYESPKFMLPIRLGTVNANGPQELFVYALTKSGRVETTNYRTVRLPTGMDLPVHVRSDFANFYRAMFSQQVAREDMRTVFLEYAWDMGWCDPCAADPLTRQELEQLGVFWLGEAADVPVSRVPGRPQVTRVTPPAGPQNVFVTRLHVRYTADRFPEDLVFQETADRTNFQGRYVLRHPFTGAASCEAGKRYFSELTARRDREAQQLATLTGWSIDDIRKKMGPSSGPGEGGNEAAQPWWRRFWP
jgi:hypothetical protein